MNFYLYRPDANNFAGIGFSSTDNERIVNVHYTDAVLAHSWIAPVAHAFEDNPEVEGDFPSLSNYNAIPVMSQRAWDVLRPLIRYCCEPLLIIHPAGEPYFIIHVMETIDCLNADRSEVIRYTDGGIMQVVRYSFRPTMLNGKHIFKLPRESGAELIVDDVFRNEVESKGLLGLQLKELPMIE